MTWQQTIDEEKDMAFEEGMKQGIEQGIEQGMKQGEHNAKVNAAKTMLADGLSVETVSKYLGLAVDALNDALSKS